MLSMFCVVWTKMEKVRAGGPDEAGTTVAMARATARADRARAVRARVIVRGRIDDGQTTACAIVTVAKSNFCRTCYTGGHVHSSPIHEVPRPSGDGRCRRRPGRRGRCGRVAPNQGSDARREEGLCQRRLRQVPRPEGRPL